MTDEKKRPEDDEVKDEQLEDVAGGIIEIPTVKKTKLPLNESIAGSGQAEGIAGSGQSEGIFGSGQSEES